MKMNGSASLSPSEAAYKTARNQAKVIQNPQMRIDQWKDYPDTEFGGDIKIVERKADTAPLVESDVPRFALHIRVHLTYFTIHMLYTYCCIYYCMHYTYILLNIFLYIYILILYFFSYLHDRGISIVVVDASGSEFDSEKLEADGLKKINGNEIR